MEVVLRAVMGNDRLRVTDVFTQQNILYPRMWTRSKKGWGKTGKTLFR